MHNYVIFHAKLNSVNSVIFLFYIVTLYISSIIFSPGLYNLDMFTGSTSMNSDLYIDFSTFHCVDYSKRLEYCILVR